MTRNQIEYWRNVETERHNKAMEEETARANAVQESLQRYKQALDLRLGTQNLAEQIRSNTARENLSAQSNYETYRSNRAREDISSTQTRNDLLINTARNAETKRSNLVNESIRQQETENSLLGIGLRALTDIFGSTTRLIKFGKSK